MSGKLYVVGTPIGNLSDMTYRAVETLKNVDFVACEDTRVSAKIMNHFELHKSLVSYHTHNTQTSGESIIHRILEGENCAVITDAGMPCISDPGEELVKLCAENNIQVLVVPGPSAAISALAISGLNTSRFSFQGFLSTTKKNRYDQLASIESYPETLIFYEAPHKLRNTLNDLLKFLGNRKISLCRELTKIHETVLRITIQQAIDYYVETEPKGEYVLVVEGAVQTDNQEEDTIESAMNSVANLIEKGMKPVDACKQIAKTTSFSKGELYTKLLENNI